MAHPKHTKIPNSGFLICHQAFQSGRSCHDFVVREELEMSRHYAEHHHDAYERNGRRVDYGQCAVISNAAAVALVGQAVVNAAPAAGFPDAPGTRAPRYDNWMPAAPVAASVAALPVPPPAPVALAPGPPPVPPPAPAPAPIAPAAATAAPPLDPAVLLLSRRLFPPAVPGQIPAAVYLRAVPADSDTSAPLRRYLPANLVQAYLNGRAAREKQARRRAQKPPVL